MRSAPLIPQGAKSKIQNLGTDAKKPGFYEKSLVWQLEIYVETRFLGSSCVSPDLKLKTP